MIVAVVPVKALAASKSRLVSHLDRSKVEALALAMMHDVVQTLLQVSSLSGVAVVTPDAHVAEAAERAGARPLLRRDPGLNPSVEGAAAELVHAPYDGVLTVLGDVAAAVPEEIAELVGALRGRGVALAPSRDGGTSALLRVPWDVIPARFGPDSAKRHRDEATRAVATYHELALPSLALDIDVAEDLEEALTVPTLGPRTRAEIEAILADAS
jgi:2-phospho-L-lactate guanylyltransferase